MSNNPYLDKLAELGYKAHNENEPLYKYTSIKTFKTILENNTLRYSCPFTFNDPFEFCDDCFDFEIEEESFRELLRYNVSLAPPEERKQFEESNIINTFSKEEFINVHKKRLEGYKQNAMVFCTSQSPLIPLMWAHYPEKHSGVCFGIKLPIDIKIEKEMVVTKSVVYNSEIKPLGILTENREQIMLAVYNWIYSKSKVWEYEKEMRTYRNRRTPIIYDKGYIIPKGADYEHLPFDKNTLVEIHYGLNTKQEDINEIEELINRKGYNNVVSRYKIAKIKGTYNLERIKLAIP